MQTEVEAEMDRLREVLNPVTDPTEEALLA